MATGNQSRMPMPGPRYFILRLPRGYFVCDPNEDVVSGPFTFKLQAEQDRDARQKQADALAKRGPRPCMKCQRLFDSDGIHNRMCQSCRHSDSPLDPVRPYLDRRGK